VPFFASILEPLFMVERFCGTKSFGLVIAGLALIMKVEINYLDGMLYALASIILGFVYAHER
jgi:hypothetical protein